MEKFKKVFLIIMEQFRDEQFMKSIHKVENFVSKILSIALIIVILVSLADLIITLVQDLLIFEPQGLFTKTLIEIFGLFLNILIALELLENVTAYLRKHIVQVELVVVTALIAVARKIIIFDSNKFEKEGLIALAIACLALSAGYFMIRYANKK